MWTGTIHSPDIHTLYKVGNNVAKDFLRDHSEKIVKILDEKWDLIVADELFAIHSYAIATFFKGREDIPYITMSTSIMNPPAAERLALAENFYTDSMEKYGVENFSWKKWYYESSANFLEYVDRVGFVTPTALDLIGTGSHCPPVGKLSQEIESFVSDPKSKGTVYIAFGSNVMWEFAPQPILDAFFDAVNELEDYRVIFSYNGIPRPVKSHVMLTKWAPQLEILGHPKTKVFVSHGGLKSLKESICAKVPIILMPMYAEQSFNAKTALYVGITSILDKHNLTKDALLSTIHKILNDKTYDERSQKIQKIYLDRLIHPLEEAGFRIGKIVKNKSFLKNFKRRGILLDYIEFLYFDVIGVCCCLMLVLFK